MEHKEFSGTWQEIWTQKAAMAGTKEDALEMGGWNKTVSTAEESAKRIVKFLDIKPEDKVLEIGCGTGGLAQYIDCDYIGIDYSRTSVEKCMEFFQKSAIYSEARELPFKDKYFDKCFAYGCFMYFPSLEYMREAVAEMRRVTKFGILIGELPRESHEPKHLLFHEKDFTDLGLKTMRGWAEPYCDIRFSAYEIPVSGKSR